MDNKLIAASIVEKLGHIRERPSMWGCTTIGEVTAILNGIRITCNIFGLPTDFERDYAPVAIERGWKWLPAAGVLPSMQERGLDESTIIDELLALEIEVWKRRFKLE